MRGVKAARLGAFAAALGLFLCQVAVARNAGLSTLDALVVVLATFAALAVIIATVVLVSVRSRRRNVAALTATRPGWVGVRAITALAAGTPATTPRQPQHRCALLFGPHGLELWAGKRAGQRLLFSASWSQVTVSPAPVSYVPGRAVVKAGLVLTPADRPPLYLTVFPERSLRTQYPAATRPEVVVATMRLMRQPADAPAPLPGPNPR